MKFNQWTVGLAAVGVISLASAARAEESAVPLMTALSSTTISGYVSASAWWNLGTSWRSGKGTSSYNNPAYPYIPYSAGKQDGFNLDVVKLTIEKPLDESQWAAGYKVDLLFGPDANGLGSVSSSVNTGDLAIQQAYVALRAPVGNGIDCKFGVFNSIIGYESFDAGNNPNYTRSYGYALEPTTHTGVLATYRFNDVVAIAGGVANSYGPMINEKAHFASGYSRAESYKTYMGSVALTAPESMGWLAGATLYGGVVNGFDSTTWSVAGGNGGRHNYYAGVTVPTPVTGLKLGAAYDYMGIGGGSGFYYDTIAGYVSWQATEKLAAHLRGEYGWSALSSPFLDKSSGTVNLVIPDSVVAVTATVDYNLWANVLTRAEFRWDHLAGGRDMYSASGYQDRRANAFLVAVNAIYKF